VRREDRVRGLAAGDPHRCDIGELGVYMDHPDGASLGMAGVISTANTPSGGTRRVVHMFVEFCTCERCGRVYRYDYRRGHTRKRCNSCRSLRPAVVGRKQRLVELRGGGCEICGYSRCLSALTFHHLDPATKRFMVSESNQHRSWSSLVEESERCVLLCSNCHREVEAHVLEIPAAVRRRVEAALRGIERRPRPRPGRPALP
jgi:hypothetical protein